MNAIVALTVAAAVMLQAAGLGVIVARQRRRVAKLRVERDILRNQLHHCRDQAYRLYADAQGIVAGQERWTDDDDADVAALLERGL